MLLCLDVGNSHIFGGVFDGSQLIATFRYNTLSATSSDQLGVFFRNVLREKGLAMENIAAIAMCSVVPHLDYTVQAACQKYFNIKPFILQAGTKTGLHIDYQNPLEVGADRIANAMGAIAQFADKNLLIIDLGTATTYCAISANRHYLGGVIQVGMRLAMNALQNNTAKLPPVEIIKPKQILGRSTIASLQSGLYYGQLATIQTMVRQINESVFPGQDVCVIGTGGFARCFEGEAIFDLIIQNLVLHGLFQAYQLNCGGENSKKGKKKEGEASC